MALDIDRVNELTDAIRKSTEEIKKAVERIRGFENELRKAVMGGTVQLSTLMQAQTLYSTPDKVTSLLKANPDKTFTFTDIFSEIGGDQPYLRSLLGRLIKEGRILRTGWGKYKAGKEDSFGTIKEKLKAV
jgi:hypothetical protein